MVIDESSRHDTDNLGVRVHAPPLEHADISGLAFCFLLAESGRDSSGGVELIDLQNKS